MKCFRAPDNKQSERTRKQRQGIPSLVKINSKLHAIINIATECRVFVFMSGQIVHYLLRLRASYNPSSYPLSIWQEGCVEVCLEDMLVFTTQINCETS